MRRLRERLAELRANEDGVSGLEFAIIAPVLVLLVFGMFQMFQLAEGSLSTQNATYILADMATRKSKMNCDLFISMEDMTPRLVPEGTWVKVRMLSLVRESNKYRVDWSLERNPDTPATCRPVVGPQLPNNLPVVNVGESLIVTQVTVRQDFPLGILSSFKAKLHDYSAAMTPRYVKTVEMTP